MVLGSTGFPPRSRNCWGAQRQPVHAGEEQGERESESVKATLDPSGNSRIEEENGATPGEKVSFEHGRPPNGSKGKSNIETPETEYREDGENGFSDLCL